ncbi:SDR family oxidoreductase [Marinicellulosiphila megalodicopiae]|uniref:SDR family oxidoreductase n=1 Tax=Marinicellulosiphila megalodicopiae TaxID=2724896 RepID=UPI003BAFD686
MKIIIIGGYGVFGGRLVELLFDVVDLEIVVSGRNLSKAEVFCQGFNGQSTIRALYVDRNNIDETLRSECPDIVIDASGPFQSYGSNHYCVIKSCIKQKVHYLDFADAAAFVFGVSKFDEEAKVAGVFVLSGVSSFPVLTAAVLRNMAKTMDIVKVQGGIAPSVFAGVGMNVMRAVLSYAGEPVTLQRNGEISHGIGLAESMRYTIAVPGKLPLNNIRFSLVDVPDLQVIPPEHPTLTDIWMGAGPVPEVLHRMLNFLSKTRAFLKLPSLVPFSRLFYTVLNSVKIGEHRGGMYVHAQGTSEGEIIEQSWHLLAEGDDGPYIPSMTIESIIRKMLQGQQPKSGARSGANALELSDYDKLFKNKNIYTGFRKEENTSLLFRQVLGSAFDTLPEEIQKMHSELKASHWSGSANVKRGKGVLVKVICRFFGFPKAENNVSVEVSITPDSNGERWVRNFGSNKFSSFLKRGKHKNEFLIVERFGVLDFGVALVIEGGELFYVIRRWSCFGLPLPSFLLPKGRSFESQKNGLFCFNIEIFVPMIGLIVSYKGNLKRTKVEVSQ